jgi:hypothetical protein
MSTSHIWQKLRFLLILGSLSILGGCSGWQPIEGSTTADDLPAGPGVFSGEKGEFVIYKQGEDTKE